MSLYMILLNNLLETGSKAIRKKKLKQTKLFLLEKFFAIMIRNIIGKLKKIRGKLVALIKEDIPKNNAHKNKK